MNLWIPTIGDAILLTADWHFELCHDRRNIDMSVALGIAFPSTEQCDPRKVSLPTGTELVIDRIYIRQGAGEFDSVTFVIKDCPKQKLIGQRFWAHLTDVNQIQCQPTTTGNAVGPFAKNKYVAAAREAANPELAAASAAKKQAKEQAKAALAATREALQTWIRGAYDGNSHFNFLVRAEDDLGRLISTRHGYLSSWWGRNYIRDAENWLCASTRRRGDLIIRTFRISYYEVTGNYGVRVTTDASGTHQFTPFVVENGVSRDCV